MKRLWLIIILSFVLLSTTAFAHPAMNLDLLKKEIVQYYETGEYLRDVGMVTEHALNYLKKRIENNENMPKKKLAIVFDIDETLISNYQKIKLVSFGGTLKQKMLFDELTDIPAIRPSWKLYEYALQHHINVFIVTGRREKHREQTELELYNAGYASWGHLYMKPNNYHERSAAPYKTLCREQIMEQGYDVVINIGDQDSDLVGGFSDRTFKLPNYMYLVP